MYIYMFVHVCTCMYCVVVCLFVCFVLLCPVQLSVQAVHSTERVIVTPYPLSLTQTYIHT